MKKKKNEISSSEKIDLMKLSTHHQLLIEKFQVLKYLNWQLYAHSFCRHGAAYP